MATEVESERPPLPVAVAAKAVVRCVAATVRLLGERRIRQPTDHVGEVLSLRGRLDGARVPGDRRRTSTAAEPCGLVVEFRLRWVRAGAMRSSGRRAC